MGECGDIGRPDGIIARSERGSATVTRNIDGTDLPPLKMRLGSATLVTLKFILNQNLRFVRIMSITPPAKHSASPYGLTTMPFWLGLYNPRTIGLSLITISPYYLLFANLYISSCRLGQLLQVFAAPESLTGRKVGKVRRLEYLMLVDPLRHILLPHGGVNRGLSGSRYGCA